jgi:predicted ATPase
LEGLPLAIELAAARISVLTPETLLKRLDRRLPLLVGRQQGQPERFSTMRSAIRWSYDLLSPSERALLRQLSVFDGGFTIEAAGEIAGEIAAGSESAGQSLLDRIGSLVEKSLVWRNGAGADLRFSMLEVIREFCFEELEARNGLEEA